MSVTLIAVMASVFIGFLLFGGSFASFMYHRSPTVVWTLFGLAVVCITVIPVVLAVLVAANPHG